MNDLDVIKSLEDIDSSTISSDRDAVCLFMQGIDAAIIKRHLILTAKEGNWELLANLIDLDPIRQQLGAVIENLLDAWYRGHDAAPIDILPLSNLNEDEAFRAFRYALEVENNALMLWLAQSGLLPANEFVQLRSERFDEEPEENYKFLVEALLSNPNFNWKTAFCFADYSGYVEVLERAKSQVQPHLYVLGFALMNDKQKHAYIKSVDNEGKLHVLELSMIVPKNWIEDLPESTKAELLSRKLGL